MELPIVVNKYKSPFTLYIGRGSIWGNPILITPTCDRDRCVHLHLLWVVQQEHLIRRLPELYNQTIGCFCKPKKCHGDNLRYLLGLLYRDGQFLWDNYKRICDGLRLEYPSDWEFVNTIK